VNDMTPLGVFREPTKNLPVRLTAEYAKDLLEGAGARNVSVVGRGVRLLAFFEVKRKRHAWIIRADGWLRNFEKDVAREFAS